MVAQGSSDPSGGVDRAQRTPGGSGTVVVVIANPYPACMHGTVYPTAAFRAEYPPLVGLRSSLVIGTVLT